MQVTGCPIEQTLPSVVEATMTHQHSVMQLTATQADQMGLLMSRAFHNEPNFTYILPDDNVRQAALSWFFGVCVVRVGLHYGEVYTTETTEGAAVWVRPGNTVTFGGALRAGMLAMPFRFGWGGFKRSLHLGNSIERVRKQVAPERHWYLMALGVAPSEQGKGIGGALLQPGLSQADADGLPCYLETFHERNVPFYEKYGFKVSFDGRITNGGPTFWAMVRTPQSHI
jgi:GNAT superfamily N-acetyltransferase